MVLKMFGSLAMGSRVNINKNKNGYQKKVHLYIGGLKSPIKQRASCAKQNSKQDYVLVKVIKKIIIILILHTITASFPQYIEKPDDRKFPTSHKISVDESHGDLKLSTVHRISNVGTYNDLKFSTPHTLSNVGTHGYLKFSTSHTMSNVGTHGDLKFSTVHRISNVGTHGDLKFSTVHTL